MELSQQEERISKKTSELHDLVLQVSEEDNVSHCINNMCNKVMFLLLYIYIL